MAIDKDRWGTARAAAVASVSVPQDAFITPAQLEEVWKKISEADKSELNGHQDIVLAASDIPVLPGTFTTPSGAVTGLGGNDAVTLMGKTA